MNASKLTTAEMGKRIDDHLDNQFRVRYGEVASAFIGKDQYNYDIGTLQKRGRVGGGPSAPNRLHRLRAETTALVRAAVAPGTTFDQSAIERRGQVEQPGAAAPTGRLSPLRGAPTQENATGPDPGILSVAERFAQDSGIDLKRQAEYATAEHVLAVRLSDAYAAMKHDPQNPKVKEAYQNFMRQTMAQYQALVDDGYEFYFYDGDTDPYGGNPWNSVRDLRLNKRMAVFSTAAGFGMDNTSTVETNPLLEDTGIVWPHGSRDGLPRPVLFNDLFRAVHDAFGHSMEGAGFRADGEENAWQAHVRLYTGSAVGAMTSETRGQNSWLNFGPNWKQNQKANVFDTVFADQKIGLMSEWTWTEGRVGDMPEPSGILYQAAPPAKGVFNANNPPSPKEGENVVVAVMNYDGQVYYDIDATMHGDLQDSFPEIIEAAFVIDGGFIIDGKYVMNMSRGGYAAIEGTDEQFEEVTAFTEQVNTVTPTVFEQAPVPALYSALSREVSAVTSKPMSPASWKEQIKEWVNKGIVKADEVMWSGLEDWIAMQEGKVSEEQVAAFLDANGVKVTVVGATRVVYENEMADAAAIRKTKAIDNAISVVEEMLEGHISREVAQAFIDYRIASATENQQVMRDAEAVIDKALTDADTDRDFGSILSGTEETIEEEWADSEPAIVDTKYEAHTLPGKRENYREVKLTLPSNVTRAELLDGLTASYVGGGVWNVTDAQGNQRGSMQRSESESIADVVNDWLDTSAAKTSLALATAMKDFKSPHWKEANVVVSIRATDRVSMVEGFVVENTKSNIRGPIFNTRAEAEANQASLPAHYVTKIVAVTQPKKVWFIEEIQSDWGQKGRKEGFKLTGKALEVEQARLLAEHTAWQKQQTEKLQKQLSELYEQERTLSPLDQKSPRNISALIAGVRSDLELVANRPAPRPSDIPSAPFVGKTEGWVNLALKQIMLMAVNEGYDSVAFINGEQSAERYDLSKKVSSIRYVHNKVRDNYAVVAIGLGNAGDINHGIVMERTLTPEELPDVVGKELADRIIAGEGKPGKTELNDGVVIDTKSFSGLDLKIGGEGMKAFYDKIVPSVLAKLLKKIGGEMGETVIDQSHDASDNDLQSFDESKVRAILSRGGEVYVGYGGGEEQLINTQDELTTYLKDNRTPSHYALGDKQPKTIQQSVAITPEVQASVGEGLPLFQAAPAADGPRGGFDPTKLAMTLGTKADLSTYLHELGHYFLTVTARLASSPNATPRMKANMQTILDWFGIKDLETWNSMTLEQQRPYHEQWAYNYEIYLFEGKAPSLEMQSIFDQFSAFMRRVYHSIRDDLNEVYKANFGKDLPIMTGEVRQVMDRMMATPAQIKRAEETRNMKPLFQTQEESGMDDTEWAAHQAMNKEASDAAVTNLTKASLRQMQWLSNATEGKLKELQAEHDALRREVRAEEDKATRLERVYRAIRYMGGGRLVDTDGEEVDIEGSHRMNTSAVRTLYPVDMEDAPDLNKIGRFLSETGQEPDAIAAFFGYTSGDEMVRDVVAAKPIREEVDARTDERMTREHGELNTPQAREAAVESALHNEARARFVAVELRWLAKITQPVRILIDAAKMVAKEILGAKRIMDIRPSDYSAAEARAARDAESAHGNKQSPETAAKAAYTRSFNEAVEGGMNEVDATAAAQVAADEARVRSQERKDEYQRKYKGQKPEDVVIQAKRNQLLQNQMAAEAIRIAEEVKKGIKYLRDVLSDKNVQRMGADHADQVARILERFELRPMSNKEASRRKKLADFIADQEAMGFAPDISEDILDETSRAPYRTLTVDQFREVVGAIKQIEHMGKNQQNVLTGLKNQAFAEAEAELLEGINVHAGDREANARTVANSKGRKIAALKGFYGIHLKVAIIARILDGGRDNGPVWNFFIRSANIKANMETTMRAEATEALTKILAPVFALGKMEGAGVFFPSIDRSLNRQERLAIALNSGNAGNLQRLLDGEGWTMEQITPVLESLTKVELNAVQEIWDYFETYRPLIAEKERRIYGKEPNWIEPQALEVMSADGELVTLRGGYYPVKYDPMATMRAEQDTDAETAREQMRGAYTSSTTRRTFTKKRAEEVKGRPLLYTLDAMYGGVNEVIHDLAWHEWLIDANRMMRSKAVDSAIRNQYGPHWVKQIKSWIQDVAVGERAVQSAADPAVRFIRMNVSAAVLGFQLVSAAIQITGFNQSITRIGARWVGRGIAATMSDPKRAFAEVIEKSEFMRNRGRTQFRELSELRNLVQDESTTQRRLTLGKYFLMMKMQRLVDVPTWWGQYEKSLSEGLNEDTAIALADQAVIDSQGDGSIHNRSAIERGGELQKLFTVFYTFMNTTFNLAALKSMTEKNKAKLAADYIMLFVVPVVFGTLLRNALRADEGDDEWDMEKLAKQLAAEQLSYLMGTMVIAREFAQLGNIMVGNRSMDYGGPAGLRMIGDTLKLAKQTAQFEFDQSFRRSALNIIGDLTGIPSVQINRTIDGIEALVEGDTTNPLAPLFGFKKK